MIPATIIYPKAFEREKSANFDGVFDWTWLSGIFPRAKIKPMDVDASIEINNWFLNFETKAYGRKIDNGQMRAIRAQTRLLHPRFGMPATRFILLWGKGLCGGDEPTRAWNHCVNGRLWERRKPCRPEHVVRFATVWGMCADRNDFSLLRAAYHHMGLTQPGETDGPARQLNLFSGDQMTHPSLADQIEAVEWAARHIGDQESVWPPALRDDAVEDMRLCLLAAVETLKTMEFARATLK